MAIKRILITVKTYPTISIKHGEEVVCTAGFDTEGNWIRIHPVPFRQLDYVNQFSKYHWIEVDLVKSKSDYRLESYQPVAVDQPNALKIVGQIGTEHNWNDRKSIVLRNVYWDLDQVISEAKDESLMRSLVVFKPTEIIGLKIRPGISQWTEKEKGILNQLELFESRKTREVVKKIPYKFSYVFRDNKGSVHEMMNEDWELGALYWRMVEKYDGDQKAACDEVYKKYWDDFVMTKDLYFFLGTTLRWHSKALNPFIIVGIFYPKPVPTNPQLKLF
ncbi:MAG: hypothetical protein V2A67_04420 [Bacteroidota bacterium]